MKLLFLSDIHAMITKPKARLDNVKETLEHKLSYVFDWATEHNAIILQAGDFGETSRSWHLLPWLQEFLFRWKQKPLFYGIYGQHDLFMHSEENKKATILGVLETAGLVKILDSAPVILEGEPLIYLYGCSYGQEIPRPIISRAGRHLNILVIHRMILSKKVWQAQTEYDWAPKFLRQHNRYDFILCGDYHYKFLYHTNDGRTILNAGCMLRKTASTKDLQHRPGFFVHDTDWERGKVRWYPIPHLPANKVLTRKHLEKQLETGEMMDEIAGQIAKQAKKARGEKTVKFEDALLDFMDVNKTRFGVRDFVLQSVKQGGE